MADGTTGSSVRRFLERLEAAPERAALVFRDRTLSFGDLDRLSRRYASGISALGVVRGDRVAVFAETAPETIVAMLGHYRLGVIHVPVNPRSPAAEAKHVLDDSGAKAVVFRAASAAAAAVEELAGRVAIEREIVIGGDGAGAGAGGQTSFERLLEGGGEGVGREDLPRDEETALIVYTSGTTGPGKGVCLSYRAVLENTEAVMSLWRVTAADRVVLALPLFHVHGLCLGVHGALVAGSTLLLQERFDEAEVVRAFEELGATLFLGVPTMYARLVELLANRPRGAASLARARLFTSGSAALPGPIFEEFRRLTGHPILERYGMTETLFTLSNPCDGERRAGTVGVPVPGCAVRIVDDAGEDTPVGEPGEIFARSSGMMSEYWGRPRETEAAFRDGWFATGDVAIRDAGGPVRIVGRKSVDVIQSGGFKISAREVEDVLRTHPLVADVSVVGAPDPTRGERIVAAVVLRPGGTAPDATALTADLAAFAARFLARYKCPREVRVLAELPRNAMGKVQKHRILELL